jgi:hypothetical protein
MFTQSTISSVGLKLGPSYKALQVTRWAVSRFWRLLSELYACRSSFFGYKASTEYTHFDHLSSIVSQRVTMTKIFRVFLMCLRTVHMLVIYKLQEQQNVTRFPASNLFELQELVDSSFTKSYNLLRDSIYDMK